MKYKIITDLSVYSEEREFDEDSFCERLSVDQDVTLCSLGFLNDCYEVYLIHFFGKDEYIFTTIDDAIQMLALKDGADLVEYENGNVGFVGYYNGFDISENSFEILKQTESKEYVTKYAGNVASIQYDDLEWVISTSEDVSIDELETVADEMISRWMNTDGYHEYESVTMDYVLDDVMAERNHKFSWLN